MPLEISGKVFSILTSQSGQGQNGPWTKQQFIIETGEKYPKKICVVGWNDKAEIISRLKVGDEVKVGLDLESREFNGKWYTDAKAWKIESLSSSSSMNAFPADAPTMEEAPPVADDLPF